MASFETHFLYYVQLPDVENDEKTEKVNRHIQRGKCSNTILQNDTIFFTKDLRIL
jgi:hypothetical protein